MILYLTYWYPSARRGKVMALFLTAVAMAGVLGGPLSGWLMCRLAGTHLLAGWQWLFLVEGLPSCVLGVVGRFYLDDKPSHANWLSDPEKSIIEDQLQRDGETPSLFRGHSFARALATSTRSDSRGSPSSAACTRSASGFRR